MLYSQHSCFHFMILGTRLIGLCDLCSSICTDSHLLTVECGAIWTVLSDLQQDPLLETCFYPSPATGCTSHLASAPFREGSSIKCNLCHHYLTSPKSDKKKKTTNFGKTIRNPGIEEIKASMWVIFPSMAQCINYWSKNKC